jgi:RNase H-fold protein (predicted Holliday junction resolvase)
MENYGDAMKYAQTSANSAGTAWEKYSTSYLNSIEAKTNALTAQFESLSQSVLDSDLVKGFVDLMTNVVKVLESILGIGDGVLLKITLFTASMAALYIALTRATAGIHKLSLKLSVMKASIATAAKETSVLNATLSALNINPVILAITAVTAVVVGLGVAFEAAEKKARENFEKIINNIEKSAEAISKFDDEIESLESLQSKLADAQGDHKKLASIYDELNRKVGASINLLKGEETAYAAVSLKLKDQIALTKKLREEELKNKINQARLGFESQTMKRSQNAPFIGQVDFAMPDLDASAMRKLMRSYGSTKSVEEVMDSIGGNVRGITHYQDIYKDIDYDMLYNSMSVDQQEHLLKDLGFTVDDWEKYWDTQVNIANEVFDEVMTEEFGGIDYKEKARLNAGLNEHGGAISLFAVKSAKQSPSTFYAIAAVAAAGMLLFQLSLNVFGITDLLPLTGVTLPFVSRGGSSMLCSWGLLAFIRAAGAPFTPPKPDIEVKKRLPPNPPTVNPPKVKVKGGRS